MQWMTHYQHTFERSVFLKKKKKIIAMTLAAAISLVTVFGSGNYSKAVSAKKADKKQESLVSDKTGFGAKKSGVGIKKANIKTADNKTDAYISPDDKQEFSKLYESKILSKDNENIILSQHESTSALMVSGNTEEIEKTNFTISKEIDFNEKSRYIVFSGIAERKRDISISFYLDGSNESFAKIKLPSQKRKNVWKLGDNECVKLSLDKISGKHKVSFKITDNNGKDYAGTDLKLLLEYMFFLEEDIPTVNVDIDESITPIASMNGDADHQTECYGNITLNIPEGYKSEYTDTELKTATYELEYIRGRGNSTWGQSKRPYKFKLDKKADLLGMGANKHWILLANYYDVSMLRNKFTYWLGDAIGLEYTPKCEFVNVVMNNKYLGSYYLCEQVRVGKSRVNIDDLAENDETKAITSGSAITGGYLLACEQESDRLNINTEKGMTFAIESPDFEDYTNVEQYNYISNYVQQTENAIFGKNFKDSDGISYDEYLDVDSAIDYYWVQEFSLNGDAFGSGSTYLYKKRNGKLYWGPLWDFDYVAWGATEFSGENQVEGLNLGRNPWFIKLFSNEKFRNKFAARWPYIKEKLLEGIKDGGIIDTYSKKQYASQKANYNVNEKYSLYDGDRFMLNEEALAGVKDVPDLPLPSGNEVTYDSEETRFKKWIRERIDWIDKNISSIDKFASGTKVTFKVGKKVYYTADFVSGTENIMPKDPTKKGYYFKGWYYRQKIDGKSYETKFTADTTLTEKKATVYAKWKKKTKVNKPKSLVFRNNEIYMTPYDDYVLKYSIQPLGAVMPEIKWSVSDKDMVSVNNGVVSATQKLGVCTVTAKIKGLKAVKCKIHVISWDDVVMIKDFKLGKTKMTLKKGKSQKLNITVLPEKVYNPNLNFVSSNKKVAEIDDAGIIHAKKKGTALIVVYCYQENIIKFCKVTVK